MFSKISILAIFVVAISPFLTLLVQSQDCSSSRIVTPRHYLNVPKFLGRWYTQKLAIINDEDIYQPPYKCLSTEWAVNEGNRIWANETYLYKNDSQNVVQRRSNEVTVKNVGEPAFITSLNNNTGARTDTIIFASDHFSYSIQYGCVMRNGVSYETAMASTRVRIADSILDSFLDSLLVGLGFPQKNFIPIDQSGCGDM